MPNELLETTLSFMSCGDATQLQANFEADGRTKLQTVAQIGRNQEKQDYLENSSFHLAFFFANPKSIYERCLNCNHDKK